MAPMEAGPLSFASISAWRQWLRRNGGRDTGTWVLVAKKGTGDGIGYREALEEALCWGWVDGKLHRHDERFFELWFAPRRPRSIWSLANRRTVEALAAEGRMQPAGLARVAEARADGRWDRATSPRAVPRMAADVARALRDAGALDEFRRLARSRRTLLLYWVGEARRAETRARRIVRLPALVLERRLPGFPPDARRR